MKVTLLALLFTLSVVSAFTIIKQEEQSLRDVNWPFKVCGKGTWTMKSLTLSNIPSRSKDLTITARGIANSKTELKNIDFRIKLNGIQISGATITFEKSLNPGEDLEFDTEFYTSQAPAGKYELIFNHYNNAQERNGCWSFSFNNK